MKSGWRLSGIRSRQTFFPLVVLICTAILSYIALIQPWTGRLTNPALQTGQVSQQDISAGHAQVFVSDVLTEEARSMAEQRVEPVFAPPDPAVARLQVTQLNDVLIRISEIRSGQSPMQVKRAELAVLQGIPLSTKVIDLILTHSPERWVVLENEAGVVLERVMRNAIRSDDLENIRQNLPSLVSLSLTVTEAQVVVEMVSPLIAPNSFYSPELTALARQAARDSIEPVVRSYVTGQTIVRRGQIISEADYEALVKLGMVQPMDASTEAIGAAVLVGVLTLFTFLYFIRRRLASHSDLRSLILMALLFLVFLYGARLTIPGRTVIPYIFPLPAFGLLFSVLFGMESGMVFSLVLSLLTAYALPNTLDLFLYYLLGSLFGIFVLGQARRVSQFLWAGLAIAGAGIAMVMAFRIPYIETDWLGVVMLAGSALLAGIASASLALLLQSFLAQFLGLTTALQLLEISRPDFPLLKEFLRRAPGTYQHSLQVVNLAEQAAEKIGADALLTRVGGLFHDIGKSLNPVFFIENQTPDHPDSHDDMDPAAAAAIIIRHVADGLELARKHRLPRRVQDFIAEHHGTLITRYQFNRAVQLAGENAEKILVEQFRYPGPVPHSRETAILMLADGIEARNRAEHPKDEEALNTLIRDLIEHRQKEGQLENTSLTQNDLRAIGDAFLATLRGTYHPRLKYPNDPLDIPTSPRKPVKKKND